MRVEQTTELRCPLSAGKQSCIYSKCYNYIFCKIYSCPVFYLCPWYGPKGICGSQDWLVVHDRLRGHYRNTPHLVTHLRRELLGHKQCESRFFLMRHKWSFVFEIRLFFTIPYTGTWGVVIGKATGAGAFWQHETGIQLATLCIILM